MIIIKMEGTREEDKGNCFSNLEEKADGLPEKLDFVDYKNTVLLLVFGFCITIDGINTFYEFYR